MDNQDLYARSRQFLKKEAEFFANSSMTGQVLRLPGVMASIVAATPDRSMFNWVIYENLDALLNQYDQIASAYDEAGVRAWTVWVDPGAGQAAKALAERGHLLDSEPVAMAAEMHTLKLPPITNLDWSATRDLTLVAKINDLAYGFPPPAFEAALDHWPEGSRWHAYVARLHGQPVGCVLVHHGDDGDCGVSGVATLPEARGQRIATRLLAVALHAAQAAGATTTSLQASPLGSGVYTALGYQNLGNMGMWERRQPKPE